MAFLDSGPPPVYDAYRNDATFRALVDTWVETTVCPVPLQDRAEELGLTSAVDAVRWVLCQPPRGRYSGGGGARGPYPLVLKPDLVYWLAVPLEDLTYHHRVPQRNLPAGVRDVDFRDTTLAVLWLLANWTVSGAAVA